MTGDRNWTNWVALGKVLRRHPPGTWLLEGGAPGADTMAKAMGIPLGFQPIEMAAMWNFHGKKAGPLRNREMGKLLALFQQVGLTITAYVVHDTLAESKGTKDMTTVLTKQGIPWTLVTSGG